MTKIEFRRFLLGAFCLLSVFSPLLARAAGEAEVQAANIVAEKIAQWLIDLPGHPGRVGIFRVKASEPLSNDYASLLESEILRQAKKREGIVIVSCFECRAPQVQVEGENIVVSKGAPDLDSLRKLAQKNGAEGFLMLDLFRTKFAVVAEAKLYNSGSGEIVGVEQFKVPAFELASTPLHFMLQGGPGRIFGPSNADSSESIPFTLNLSALEELGFGKGGLTVGGIFAGPNGNMGYILPTIALRGRFGATPVFSLASLGAGFGMTGSKAGLAIRPSFDIFLGSFALLGVDAAYLVPVKGMKTGEDQTLSGYVGVHLGISIGR